MHADSNMRNAVRLFLLVAVLLLAPHGARAKLAFARLAAHSGSISSFNSSENPYCSQAPRSS